ncbi:MAG: SH3 domain-containing protein, partial [Anaerolineae bacterium]|nr:SH3 domain-containing protein [Anaerolineae bacterium]
MPDTLPQNASISLLPVVDSSVSTPVPGVPTSTPVAVATAVPTAIVPTTIPNTAVINTSALNVRSGPGVGYVRVTTVDYGEVVWLLGRNLDSTWINIADAGNIQGWVNARYLTTSSNLTNLPVTAQSGTGTVVAGNLNIRSEPGIGGSVVTVASYGSAVVLLG